MNDDDDAIHIQRSRWSRKTLCGKRVNDRNVVVQGHFWPDVWEGCWMCLERAGLSVPALISESGMSRQQALDLGKGPITSDPGKRSS